MSCLPSSCFDLSCCLFFFVCSSTLVASAETCYGHASSGASGVAQDVSYFFFKVLLTSWAQSPGPEPLCLWARALMFCGHEPFCFVGTSPYVYGHEPLCFVGTSPLLFVGPSPYLRGHEPLCWWARALMFMGTSPFCLWAQART